jgi:hypothetical protein
MTVNIDPLTVASSDIDLGVSARNYLLKNINLTACPTCALSVVIQNERATITGSAPAGARATIEGLSNILVGFRSINIQGVQFRS